MKTIRPLLSLFSFFVLFWLNACGSAAPDLIPLEVEVVDDPTACEESGYCTHPPEECPEGHPKGSECFTEPPPNPELVDDIFKGQHGEWYRLSAIGAIDAQTTNLALDFDGDGLNNDDEAMANMWVADYPRVSTNVAPPVTISPPAKTPTLFVFMVS